MYIECAGDCGRETSTYPTPEGDRMPPGWDWIPGKGARCPHCTHLGSGLKVVPKKERDR